MLKSIVDVVEKSLCIGCGLCSYSTSVKESRYSTKDYQPLPVVEEAAESDPLAYEVCPGKGYDIVKEAERLHDSPNHDLELGRYYNLYAGFSNDRQVLENASSGGIASQIAVYLLEERIVDRVLTTSFQYTDLGPLAKGILAGCREEVMGSQGSKYCPVDLSEGIGEAKKYNHRLAVIGTPCQIAGIRNIQRNDPSFNSKLIVTVSNFCGGFKNYRNISLIAKLKDIEPRDITFFRFRGGGQPGSMLIRTKSGRSVQIAYPDYVGLNGLSKHLRCHLCVDATGELADIACGDAWLHRFLNDKNPWSIFITRNKKADDLMNCLIKDGAITTESISQSEVKQSQEENLYSKKVRQKSRFYLYRKLGYAVPSFDGGFFDNPIDLWTEVKVFHKHRLKELLETLGLFHLAHSTYKSLRLV